MPFSRLDTGAIGRSLAQVAERPDDIAEVYLERLETIELPTDGEGAGLHVWREEGLAVRLLREGLSWIAARDGFESRQLAAALRQVARALPQASYPEPALEVAPWREPPEAPAVLAFPALLARCVRAQRAAFPYRLRVRRHRRWVQVVGRRLVPDPERESFYSCAVELPWGRYGTVLPELGEAEAADLAASLVGLFRARDAPPPAAGPSPVVFGPAATAVLLHEAVSHALEADTLILGGRPEAAQSLQLGSRLLNVLDDPGTAPEQVRRGTDDEGIPVMRRWLLREGVVVQPLADSFAARKSAGFSPGAARRSGRHFPPVPRSTHLELVPGESSRRELLGGADGGLFFAEASRGRLEPLSGEFSLTLPYGRRIRAGELGEVVGACRAHGRVADLLRAASGVGRETRTAGAGWCAKGGQRLAVWATAPHLRVDEVEIGA